MSSEQNPECTVPRIGVNICAAAGEAYRMDLDAANHDAAVWTAVCAVLALAGIAGLVVSVTKIEYGGNK